MLPSLSRFLCLLVVETIAQSPRKRASLLQSATSHRATPLALLPHAEQDPRTQPGEDDSHSSDDVGFSMLQPPGLPKAGVSFMSGRPQTGKVAADTSNGELTPAGQMVQWTDRELFAKIPFVKGLQGSNTQTDCELIRVATECNVKTLCRWDTTLESRPSSDESYDEYEDGADDDDDETGLCVQTSPSGQIVASFQRYTTRGMPYSSRRYLDRDFLKYGKMHARTVQDCAKRCAEDRRCTLFRWQQEHAKKYTRLPDGSWLTSRMTGSKYPFKCHIYVGATCAPQARFRAHRPVVGRHWTYYIDKKRWNLNCSEEEEKAAIAGVVLSGECAPMRPLVLIAILAMLL